MDVYPYMLQENNNIRFLFLLRKEDGELPSSWQPVSGKILKGETIRAAFKRLVVTKTGQQPTEMYKLDRVNIFYDDYYDTVMFVPSAACRLSSNTVVLSSLHSDYKWVNEQEATELLEWETQRQYIQTISKKLKNGKGFGRFHTIKLNE